MKANLQHLRYATSHYLQLQGLRSVALGIMLFLLLLALRLESPWDKGLFALLLALLGLSWWKIGAYYERRFGRVEHLPARYRSGLNLRWIAVLLLVLLAVFAFPFRISWPEWMLSLLFAGLWAVEKRRWYYLLFAAAFVAISVISPAPHPRLGAVELWLVPVAFILGGILDHYYLVRSLPGARCDGHA